MAPHKGKRNAPSIMVAAYTATGLIEVASNGDIPGKIAPELQELAVLIGHLARDADLVAVEVVGLLAAFSVFCDHQRRKTQNYRLIREAPAGLFAEPNLFTLEQYRLLIIFIHP